MNLLIRWFASAATLMLIPYIVPGISIGGVYIALVTAVLLGLVNAVIRPIFIVLTLPINIVTFGLFTLIINGCMFWFVSSFVDGFQVEGFWAAFWGALVLAIVSTIVNQLIRADKT